MAARRERPHPGAQLRIADQTELPLRAGQHMLPTFGPMRMGEILPMHVREWVTERVASGVTPASIRHSKNVLSAIFTTALNDLVIGLHPCKGVKSPTVAVKEYRILTPEESDQLQAAFPCQVARLLVETLIVTGCRWGEATELRLRDLHVPSTIVTVSRAVVEVDLQFRPTGDRFLVKPYPKSRRSRRFKMGRELADLLVAHAEEHGLGLDDLLFSLDLFTSPARRTLVDVEDLGATEPNEHGRTYRHGTLSAYTAGKCRWVHCRQAFATYRAERRATGLDEARAPRCARLTGTCRRSGSATTSGSWRAVPRVSTRP